MSSSLQEFIQNSYKGDDQKKYINGYERDNDLSGQRVQVYHNKDTGKAVVVHRGTQGLNDWITDTRLILNPYGPYSYEYGNRYQHAKKIQEQAKNKYGKENITTVGHSLGGKLAHDLGGDTNKTITYNKAITPIDLVRPINKQETHIRAMYDPVSLLSPFDATNTITFRGDSLNPITIHKAQYLEHFKPEDGRLIQI